MVGGAILSTWNFGSTGPRWSKIADFEPTIARSASVVTPSEISLINTNRKSTTGFPVSLRWSSYVAPKSPKGGSKAQNGRFPSKIALPLKKVCYKVSLCENFYCQRQSSKAFIGLPIRGKKIDGRRPLLPEILGQTDRVGAKSPDFRSIFIRSASAVRPSEKSSINLKRKSTTRFPMSPRWTSCIVHKPPQGGSKTQNVQNLNNNNKRAFGRDRMSFLNYKSLIGSRIQAFDWYRPWWHWMTLNGLIALILRFHRIRLLCWPQWLNIDL